MQSFAPIALPVSQTGTKTLRHIAGVPFIYGMAIPIGLLDLAVSLYQAVCFRLWRIPAVRRSAHVSFARAELPYLNPVQRLHCGYCSYANGVLVYAAEIAARTEQYWCPIQHREPPVGVHDRYGRFLPYGDPVDLDARIDRLRTDLREGED